MRGIPSDDIEVQMKQILGDSYEIYSVERWAEERKQKPKEEEKKEQSCKCGMPMKA